MEPSIFTKIIEGEIPCHKVYEDDSIIAFLDIHPLKDGHTLIIPKQQVDHIWDLPDEIYDKMWAVSKEIAPKLQEIFRTKRVGVIVEGFGVPHAHIHLVPINSSDELKSLQDLSAEPDHEKLTSIACQIKDRL